MSLVPILRNVDVFYELTDAQLERIAAICQEKRCPAGTVIFDENSASDELYIVVSGEVEILVDPRMLGVEQGPGPTTIATIHAGQIFGEVALVDQGLRSAAARCAAHDTRLLVIRREDLLRLCEEDYELGYRVMRNIASALAFKIRSTDILVRGQLLWRPK